MKKLIALLLSVVLCLSLAACGQDPGKDPQDATKDPDDATTKYTVGICQFTQHDALDAATKGFRDALEEALPGQVEFDELNASNDIPTCQRFAMGLLQAKSI